MGAGAGKCARWLHTILLANTQDKILMHFALNNLQEYGEKYENCTSAKTYFLLLLVNLLEIRQLSATDFLGFVQPILGTLSLLR